MIHFESPCLHVQIAVAFSTQFFLLLCKKKKALLISSIYINHASAQQQFLCVKEHGHTYTYSKTSTHIERARRKKNEQKICKD